MLLTINLKTLFFFSENLHCISTGNIFSAKFDFGGVAVKTLIVSYKNIYKQ